MAKAVIVWKNACMRLSETKEKTGEDSVESPTKGLFCHILIHFHLLKQKNAQQKHFPK